MFDAIELLVACFRMALLYESENAELRRINREKLLRAVSRLPRTSDVASFLADIAQHVLNLHMRIEDTLLLAEGIVPDDTSVKRMEVMMHSLRAAVPAVQELYGKVYMAAATDCASVVEATQVAEEVLGLTTVQVKAIRELHAKQTLLRKIKESDVHNVQGLPQRHPAAVTATAAKSLALVYSSPAPKTAPKPAPIRAAFSSVQQPKVSYWFLKKKPHPQFCTLTASSIRYVIGGYLYCHKIQIQINSQKVNYFLSTGSVSDLGPFIQIRVRIGTKSGSRSIKNYIKF